MKRVNVVVIAGVILICYIGIYKPYGTSSNPGFTNLLRLWGNQQEEVSEKVASTVVSGVEGQYVGNHEIHGKNWSIPNIIRYWTIADREDLMAYKAKGEDKLLGEPDEEDTQWSLFEILGRIIEVIK